METNTSEIINEEFKKCEIVPIDRMKVLDRIPKDLKRKGTNTENMENSLVDISRQLRYGNDEPNKNSQKHKRINNNLRVQTG